MSRKNRSIFLEGVKMNHFLNIDCGAAWFKFFFYEGSLIESGGISFVLFLPLVDPIEDRFLRETFMMTFLVHLMVKGDVHFSSISVQIQREINSISPIK